MPSLHHNDNVGFFIERYDAMSADYVVMSVMWYWVRFIARFILTEFDETAWIPTFDMVLSWHQDPRDRFNGTMTVGSGPPGDSASYDVREHPL